MVMFKKLTQAEYDAWKLKFVAGNKNKASDLGEKFMTENFPGHVDHRLDGVSVSDQERIIVSNYVVPKDST